MTLMPDQVNQLIRSRRSIFPKTYNGKEIAREIIEEILENANWAPTHRFTEPWRFKIFRGDALERLSEYMSNHYLTNTPESNFSEVKFNKTRQKPLQSSCVIAICMQRDPKNSVPEWEEIAAVACAVQNMWLTATAYDIGAYWSSPKYIEDIGGFLDLDEGQKCLGFFYMGYHDLPEIPGKRSPISQKIEWLED